MVYPTKGFGHTIAVRIDEGKDLVEPLEWRKRSPIGGANLSSYGFQAI